MTRSHFECRFLALSLTLFSSAYIVRVLAAIGTEAYTVKLIAPLSHALDSYRQASSVLGALFLLMRALLATYEPCVIRHNPTPAYARLVCTPLQGICTSMGCTSHTVIVFLACCSIALVIVWGHF